jgi:hypothetical protein
VARRTGFAAAGTGGRTAAPFGAKGMTEKIMMHLSGAAVRAADAHERAPGQASLREAAGANGAVDRL